MITVKQYDLLPIKAGLKEKKQLADFHPLIQDGDLLQRKSNRKLNLDFISKLLKAD